MRVIASIVIALAVVATGPVASTPATPPPARLQGLFGVTPGQAVLLDRGRIIVRTLDTARAEETAVFGAVKIAVPTTAFLGRFRDIESYKRHEAVRQLGRFGMPPTPDDVSTLTLPPGEVEDLRACKPGDCKLKLPAAWMDRLRRTVDWTAPDWRARTLAAFRGMLVEYVADYLARGDAALIEYGDKKTAVSLASEFRGLVNASPYLAVLSPEFAGHLRNFPRPLAGAEDFIYWSQEDYGIRPVVSVTHVSTYRDPSRPELVIGATKQIYADHYFTASLGLTIGIDAGPDATPPGMYLFYVNRSRTDGFGGLFGGLKRGVVERRSRKSVETILAVLRARLESAPRSAPDAARPASDPGR